MAILRRGPFRQLRKLERQLDDLFAGDTEVEDQESSPSLTDWSPRVDVYEENDELVFEVDAPGINKDDLDVSINDNRLQISGERREERDVDEEARNYFRAERVYGSFKRSFALPDRAGDPDQINARYEDGVLTVRVPRMEESTSESIQIN